MPTFLPANCSLFFSNAAKGTAHEALIDHFHSFPNQPHGIDDFGIAYEQYIFYVQSNDFQRFITQTRQKSIGDGFDVGRFFNMTTFE